MSHEEDKNENDHKDREENDNADGDGNGRVAAQLQRPAEEGKSRRKVFAP